MTYRVDFTAAAARQLKRVPESVRARLAPHINALADNPHPAGSKRLKGTNGYRLRVGDYRILYEIHDELLLVLIVRVGHRREVYRTLGQ